ncbi:ABC transporter permease [Clostridium sp. chh4-2]|uniref:carbohydrate ABC transporter permease n=1 Tax=Clostridium sp. chh4-2 TaxID=2067550 RepID=UPI000CCEC6AB|nr:sugar ABC transporter permease [Clostridium sp. chh4-2]PNV60092.1 ABC transporter permease [Clostridium sp. chh4-2]
MTEKKRRSRRENLLGYLIISPWLAGLLVFTFIPMVYSLYLSFTNFDGISTPKWIGLDNYMRMFQDERFFISLKVTFTYVALLVPLRLAFALLIAMLLNSNHRGLGIYRSVFYLPSLLGGSVAIAIMWGQLFGADGAINSVIRLLGGEVGISWIGNTKTALGVLVVLGIWQFGASMLIFIAGLKQIPVTYYEAATLDGASGLQKFKSITLPMLSPVIFFNVIMQIINAFKAFNESYIITKGGPLDKTLFYALYIYKQSFEYFNMGYGSALAWVLLLIIAVFAVFIFKSSNSWVYYETKGD